MDIASQVLNNPAFSFKLPPMSQQIRALYEGADATDWGFFMEMGTGKTKTLLDNAAYLFNKGKIKGLLVLAPKGVFHNWTYEQIPEHMAIPYTCVEWSATVTDEKSMYKYFKPDPKRLVILVMNIETLSVGRGRYIARDFLKAIPDSMMVIDESTTIKAVTSTRTDIAIKLGKMAKYRRLLSGDPMLNSPEDIYGQALFFGPQYLGFYSLYAFRAHYCEMKQIEKKDTDGNIVRRYSTVAGYKNIDELKAKVKTFSTRVLKSECLDLPPKVYAVREVELTETQVRLLKTLKKEALAFLENQTIVTAPMIITRLEKQHQVVCGFIKDDQGNEHEVANNKYNELMSVLEETSGKVLIWCGYRHNVKKVIQLLTDKYGHRSLVHYYGGTTGDERPQMVKKFKENDDCRFFVGNPSVGKYGLTLTQSSTSIYLSNSFKLEDRTQSEDRIHRIGQGADKVTYVDLICRRTIDEKIIMNLKAKRDLANEIVGGPDDWRRWFTD